MSRHAHPEDLTAEHPAVQVGPATGPIDLSRVPAPRRGELPPGPYRTAATTGDEQVTAPAAAPGLYTRMPEHDGASSWNVLRRAEPKVRAAAIAAVASPVALFYAHTYLPGVDRMPTELLVGVDAGVTGLVVFLAGFAAKAVDRIDLWFADRDDPA